MKKSILITIAVLINLQLFSQQVISSKGNTYNGTTAKIQSTIGESFIGNFEVLLA